MSYGWLGAVRDEGGEARFHTVGAVLRGERRGRLQVVLRQEGEQVAHLFHRLGFVGGDEVGDSGEGSMALGPSEGGEVHLFPGDRLDDVGAGDEQVAGPVDLEDEVGDGRGVHRPAGAGAQDHRDLRDDPGSLHVAPEDLPVGIEGDDPLLDPGPAGVLEPDEGGPVLHGQVHHLADLLAHRLAQAAAEHRGVLGEHEDGAAFDGAPAGDHGVPGGAALLDAEAVGAVADQGVDLDEGSGVEESGEALAGGALPGDGGAPLHLRRLAAQAPQMLDPLLCAHAAPVILARRCPLDPGEGNDGYTLCRPLH